MRKKMKRTRRWILYTYSIVRARSAATTSYKCRCVYISTASRDEFTTSEAIFVLTIFSSICGAAPLLRDALNLLRDCSVFTNSVAKWVER